MIAAVRLALSLVASLLLWLPTVPAALTAGEQPEAIATRYLLCLVVARLGVGLLFRVVTAYAAGQEEPAEAEGGEDADHDDDTFDAEPLPFGRRRDDVVDADDDALFAQAADDDEESTALAS